MECPFCSHSKTHEHGRILKGHQRFQYSHCRNTFTETFGSLYYRRQLPPDEVHTFLQSHSEGSSLRGISRISQRAYGTVVSLVQQASQKA